MMPAKDFRGELHRIYLPGTSVNRLSFERRWASFCGMLGGVGRAGHWYYPLFWTAHLVGGLPPGKDHVHQVVFIILSLVGLLLPVREFFGRREAREPTTS